MIDLVQVMKDAHMQSNMRSRASIFTFRASATVVNQLRNNEPMEDTMKWLNENATPLEGGMWEIAPKESK